MRIRTTAAALSAAAASAALLGLAAHASGAPADRPGVRLYDEALGKTRGDGATVCTFYLKVEGFAPDQPVNWTVAYARGEDAIVGTLVTGDRGTGSTDRIVLSDGRYRLRWVGAGAKPQRFTVACPDVTRASSSGTASTGPSTGPSAPAGAVPGVTAAASTGPGTGLPAAGLTSASTAAGPSGLTAGVASALAALGIASIAALVMLRRKPAPRRHRRVSG
ncbi:hypothetical protein [Streptomyces sp. NPDC001070]